MKSVKDKRTRTKNLEEQFVHVFLVDGSPVVQLSCGSNHVLSVTADQSINTDRWVNLTVRYNLPVGKQGGSCMIELAVDNGKAQHLEDFVSHPVSEETFGPIFLGALSSHREMPSVSAKGARRFMGCIREFWVNSKEMYLVGEGTTGRNIKNCEPLVCQLLPCRNGGTCVRLPVFANYIDYMSNVDIGIFFGIFGSHVPPGGKK
ncbi:protein eyes shut homolog, partial [Eucyclogobius newberryi]|uniref:protein eyes shut homolog n=1 Tax=Eucyclogobius newberryi TaxID=166745 RepID=UPI003B5989D0